MIRTARRPMTPGPAWLHYLVIFGTATALAAGCIQLAQRSTYYPGLSPIAGHRLWNATQPRGLPALLIKGLQAGWFEATPCAYTILGWDAGGALYFEALCVGQLQLWTARPEAPESVRQVRQLPAGVAGTPLSKNDVFPLVRAAVVWPASAEPPTRRVHIQSQPYPSPDGAWLAFVSQHSFGPQDVLLLTASAPTHP